MKMNKFTYGIFWGFVLGIYGLAGIGFKEGIISSYFEFFILTSIIGFFGFIINLYLLRDCFEK